MNVNEYEKAHEKIWAEYRRRYSGDDEHLAIDGLVDAKSYDENSGIVFLLKEANQKNRDEKYNNECKWWHDYQQGAIWNRIAEWTFALTETSIDDKVDYETVSNLTKTRREEFVRKTAILNINKVNGEGSQDEYRIKKAIRLNRDLLCLEIALMSPRIIVCGGTSQWLGKIIEKVSFGQGAYMICDLNLGEKILKNVLLISTRHPSRASKEKTYNHIADSIQQAMKNGWHE